MQAKQRRVLESFWRVRSFLAANPAPPPASYAGPREVLEDVVTQFGDHSGAQVFGKQFSRAELRRQEALMRKLREHHMRPIVAIARSEVKVTPGITEALRLPPSNLGVEALLAAATAMRKSAAVFEQTFVSNALPADFLERFDAAVAAIESAVDGRATNVGTHVGAKAGIAQELQRGRRAVERLDSLVRVVFDDNDVVMARWRVAKRIKALPSGGGTETSDPAVAAGGAQQSAA